MCTREEHEEKKKSGLASAGESAVLLAVITAIAVLAGAKYYDGFYDYFSIKAYLLQISIDRLIAESLYVLWQLLAILAVTVVLVASGLRGTEGEPPRAGFLAPLLAAATGFGTLLCTPHVDTRSHGLFEVFVVSWILVALAVAWFMSVRLRKLWGTACAASPGVMGSLLVIVLALPLLLGAYARGRSLAMRGIEDQEGVLTPVTKTDGAPLLPGPGRDLLLLQQGDYLTIVEAESPPPERPLVHVVKNSSDLLLGDSRSPKQPAPSVKPN